MNEDRFLAARMLRGDEAAFSEFFDANFAPLYRFALPRVGGNAQVAEEVVQSALCRAMRKMSTYRGEAALLTWVTTICRREIATWFEQRKGLPPMVAFADDIPEIRSVIESLSTNVAEDALRQKEIAQLVQLVLDRLPARYGDALEWKYIEDLSVNEIARRLGVAPKAAESVLTRARTAFRDAFTAAEAHS
ncbi:MAG: RNA polymerase sigma factor [Thermoanaerobaculia bacterium]